MVADVWLSDYAYLEVRTSCSRSDDEPPAKRPPLSRMALDLLTIQPMSTECKRLFSAAGKMVSGLRTNLDAEIIAIARFYALGTVLALSRTSIHCLSQTLKASWMPTA